MAPTADAAARRSAAARAEHRHGAAAPRPDPRHDGGEARRPPLRLFEPAPRRRPGTGRARLRRSTMWLSCLMVVGSLLAVVVGDTLLAQGQVRLSSLQHQVAAAEAVQKASQVAVAERAAPPVVVSQAEAQGLVAPTQVVYLPHVPLDVPLPVPQTVAPLGRATTGTGSPGVTAKR